MATSRHVLTVCFTNFGPYHRARLEALGSALRSASGELIAYELAGKEEKYPWESAPGAAEPPYRHIRLFPERSVESLTASECRRAMRSRLDRDQPTAIGAVGYVRPESLEMARWAKSNGALRILLSESQRVDHTRTWWKEAIKARRVARFQAGVVGGESHKSYLVDLGMPADRIHLGYNAVGNAAIEVMADTARAAETPVPMPYFLTVCRFAPEKNLETLIRAYAAYVRRCESPPWHLALVGDGPQRPELQSLAVAEGVEQLCHWPGFLPIERTARWYVHAGAFVLASRSEPWGLVVNEAALCGAPLLISDRCGAAGTFVPKSGMPTGRTFNPNDAEELTERMTTMAALSPAARRILGDSARSVARAWGPDRFAEGVLAALESAAKPLGTVSLRP
ncbi:glycosyltransferase [bacterium]|nr:glycosyltransferase [bacterium]